MNTLKALILAGVPEHLHAEALASLALAKERSLGLDWHKTKVRLFRAGKVADMLPWEAERVLDVRPDLADWDIEPMVNITCNGDHAPRVQTPDGYRPAPDRWLNPDPSSEEYREACADPISQRYFGGAHPRSHAARKMWYRRNGGAYLAWKRGIPIAEHTPPEHWQGSDGKTTVTVTRSGNVWIVASSTKLLGPLTITRRDGFEVDNVYWLEGVQSWYPIPGHDLRAPATWGWRLRWRKGG